MVSGSVSWGQDATTPFKYPSAPDNLETLGERTTYLVEHFWDRCNLKSIFSSTKNFDTAFEDYISFFPYADSSTVIQSVEHLIKEVKKTPTNMLTLARTAREKLYGDSAEMKIDAVYLLFAKAALESGNISKSDKEQFSREVSQLSHSQEGMILPAISMIKNDGSNFSFNDINDKYILLFFDEPGNFDNMLARTRLATDYALNELIDLGYVEVISIYPGNADLQWKERVKDYPGNWIVVASPDADMLFDRRITPTFYYCNKNREILSKNLQVDNLIEAFRIVSNNRKQVQIERERLKQEVLQNKHNNDRN